MKKLTGIGAAEYARRRKQLMQMAGEQAILILPAAPERCAATTPITRTGRIRISGT